MVVARNCRKRRSLAARISSPTSFTLPPEGTSEPFCSSPITVSDVTDLPEPLSPTRHRVSPSCTCSDTPSMTRSLRGFLPRPTTRLSISRMMLVMAPLSHRHCERSEAIQLSSQRLHKAGLLRRYAPRNDGVNSLAALPLFHAGIERVAGGVADQVDAEDRDRQQQAGPEDQRWFDLKIGAALGHEVAPGV